MSLKIEMMRLTSLPANQTNANCRGQANNGCVMPTQWGRCLTGN